MNSTVTGERPPDRGGKWRWVAAVLGAALAIQSITITAPIDLSFVDADSRVPVVGLQMLAVWRLHAATAGGASASSVLKVQRLLTDSRGRVHVNATAMLHAPLVPFGFGVRDARTLPVLYVIDERNEPRQLGHDAFNLRDPPPRSFLSLQRTSIHGDTVLLRSIARATDELGRREIEDHRDALRFNVDSAYAGCSKRWLCQGDER